MTDHEAKGLSAATGTLLELFRRVRDVCDEGVGGCLSILIDEAEEGVDKLLAEITAERELRASLLRTYTRLEAEVERLTAMKDTFKAAANIALEQSNSHATETAALKAEVERLRGALERSIEMCGEGQSESAKLRERVAELEGGLDGYDVDALLQHIRARHRALLVMYAALREGGSE